MTAADLLNVRMLTSLYCPGAALAIPQWRFARTRKSSPKISGLSTARETQTPDSQIIDLVDARARTQTYENVRLSYLSRGLPALGKGANDLRLPVAANISVTRERGQDVIVPKFCDHALYSSGVLQSRPPRSAKSS